jgi:Secretion system C-terminal sorting domain
MPASGNPYLILAKQYIATRLNRAKATEPITLSPTVLAAYDAATNFFMSAAAGTSAVPTSGLNTLLENYIQATHCGSSQVNPLAVNKKQGISIHGGNKPTIVTYPNPATDNIQIQFSDFSGEKLNIMIYDLRGALILSKQIDNTPFYGLNIGDITRSSGVYVIRVTDEKSSVSKLFNVQK